MLLVGIFIGMPIVIISAVRGNVEARIFAAGMLTMMLAGLYDILAEFGVIPLRIFLFTWSTLVFTIILSYIL